MQLTLTTVRSILTRTHGYLRTVSSHSAQPYRGCTLGRSLCGVSCYVQHNAFVTRGRPWGGFLEVRTNAATAYHDQVARERRWAQRARGVFSVFLSSSTDPFLPQERTHGITRQLLAAMEAEPPDELIVQTHTHRVTDASERLLALAARCRLRVQISIETDHERIAGLPRHASPVERRFEAAQRLRDAGLDVVVTVSPLLPIGDPEAFFARIARSASAVVIDHFIGGDGTPDGRRTRRTPLPEAMAALDPASLELEYRDRMVAVARRHLPGRVGVHIDGFAGRYLP
jgi:DNA repair photolyase